MSKHYFLGGNTPYGFFSYYDYLIDQKDAAKIYCIKGGPGTGKSSLMKKIANIMEERGFRVDYAHCSSDPDSLDGVVIKDKRIAFVDGTSPHIVDPKTPGAVDKILNMGEFWDEAKIRLHKSEIIKCSTEISKKFARAYKYLAAAKPIWDDTNEIYSRAISDNVHERFANDILKSEFISYPISVTSGKVRKLFSTAFTPKGIIDTSPTLTDKCKVYIIEGYTGNVLDMISAMAVSRGMDVEKYYSPMEPSKLCEHLVIPDLKIAFISSNHLHKVTDGEIINFADHYDSSVINQNADTLSYNAQMVDELIQKATSTIAQAKVLHDELEGYYVPYMDFDKIDKEYERIIKTL